MGLVIATAITVNFYVGIYSVAGLLSRLVRLDSINIFCYHDCVHNFVYWLAHTDLLPGFSPGLLSLLTLTTAFLLPGFSPGLQSLLTLARAFLLPGFPPSLFKLFSAFSSPRCSPRLQSLLALFLVSCSTFLKWALTHRCSRSSWLSFCLLKRWLTLLDSSA